MSHQKKRKVYLTGSTGFVGTVLHSLLLERGFEVQCGDRPTGYSENLNDVDYVIHLAAKVHDFNENSYKPYFESNVLLTQKLLERAISAGVKKFIFLSSIKVNGEENDLPYFETNVPCPSDIYGKSKWEAEKVIQEVSRDKNISYTIIRPPLIYGPNVKANFKKLISVSTKNIPLPFGSIYGKRSFIFVENLGSLIIRCLETEKADNKVFLVRDDTNLSTRDLISLIREINGSPRLIFKFPLFLLRLAFKIIGKDAFYTRLAMSLSINDSATRTELSWNPEIKPREALSKTLSFNK